MKTRIYAAPAVKGVGMIYNAFGQMARYLESMLVIRSVSQNTIYVIEKTHLFYLGTAPCVGPYDQLCVFISLFVPKPIKCH